MDWSCGLTLTKDPVDVIDFVFDWNDATDPWLADGETISSFVVSAEAGLTVDSSNESGGVVTVFVSGGTADKVYELSCRITTSQGRTAERSIYIDVTEC